jgi:hypothetical protein
MRIASHRSDQVCSRTALCLVLTAALLAGCSSPDETCERGTAGTEQAVTEFLAAVAAGDSSRTEQLLMSGNTVDQVEFDLLHGDLEGVALDRLVMSDEQIGTRHAIEVTSPNTGVTSTFEVEKDPSTGCAAVVWGIGPDIEEPAPGESDPASVG